MTLGTDLAARVSGDKALLEPLGSDAGTNGPVAVRRSTGPLEHCPARTIIPRSSGTAHIAFPAFPAYPWSTFPAYPRRPSTVAKVEEEKEVEAGAAAAARAAPPGRGFGTISRVSLRERPQRRRTAMVGVRFRPSSRASLQEGP